jgi:hypothetical protein
VQFTLLSKKNRPSFGRSRKTRGHDQFDTPPIALAPLFAHEPLLTGVTAVCEPFCGKGNLVVAMRERGLTVHASDIEHRGCPDSTVLDFRKMTARPCDVLVSNPPFADAMGHVEHALDALRFRVVVLLLPPSFLFSGDRFERLHPRGQLRRVHPIAERLQDMHDAKHLAAGGKEGSQSQIHGWFVFDRNHFGPAAINPVSIKHPDERMPWATDNANRYHEAPVTDNGIRYHGPRGTSRGYVMARLARAGRIDLAAEVESGGLSARAALRRLTGISAT